MSQALRDAERAVLRAALNLRASVVASRGSFAMESGWRERLDSARDAEAALVKAVDELERIRGNVR